MPHTLTRWRAMTEPDLDRVAEIALIGFPNHFEGRPMFANRLALSAAGCFVLQTEGGLEGYIIAYPWSLGTAPVLNTPIEALPDRPDVVYLHDLVLTPAVRGQGQSKPAVAAVVEMTKDLGLPTVALVAVNDAVDFWTGHGFEVLQTPGMGAKLASYGSDARYMTRPV